VTDAGYRRYIKAFGYELALKGIELAEHFERLSTDTHADTVAVLTAQLHHLDESAIRRRMDSVVRFIALSMSVQAGQKQPFRGPNADLFYCELLDVVGGILSAGTTSPNES